MIICVEYRKVTDETRDGPTPVNFADSLDSDPAVGLPCGQG